MIGPEPDQTLDEAGLDLGGGCEARPHLGAVQPLLNGRLGWLLCWFRHFGVAVHATRIRVCRRLRSHRPGLLPFAHGGQGSGRF
jgi:hypothetical protein